MYVRVYVCVCVLSCLNRLTFTNTSDVVEKYCGERGVVAYEACFSFLCSIPHPTLQLFYLGLIAFGYSLGIDTMYYHIAHYANSSDRIALEQRETHIWNWWSFHLYTIPLIVDATLISFLVVSFSNPGVVNADNVHKYIKLYPYDNVLYIKKPICKTW